MCVVAHKQQQHNSSRARDRERGIEFQLWQNETRHKQHTKTLFLYRVVDVVVFLSVLNVWFIRTWDSYECISIVRAKREEKCHTHITYVRHINHWILAITYKRRFSAQKILYTLLLFFFSRLSTNKHTHHSIYLIVYFPNHKKTWLNGIPFFSLRSMKHTLKSIGLLAFIFYSSFWKKKKINSCSLIVLIKHSNYFKLKSNKIISWISEMTYVCKKKNYETNYAKQFSMEFSINGDGFVLQLLWIRSCSLFFFVKNFRFNENFVPNFNCLLLMSYHWHINNSKPFLVELHAFSINAKENAFLWKFDVAHYLKWLPLTRWYGSLNKLDGDEKERNKMICW